MEMCFEEEIDGKRPVKQKTTFICLKNSVLEQQFSRVVSAVAMDKYIDAFNEMREKPVEVFLIFMC